MADQLSLAKLYPDTVREAARPLPDETPRARFLAHGEQALSDAEIVSLVADIPIEEARMVLHGGLRGLSQRDWRFSAKDARSKKITVRLAAALELGRRITRQAWSDPEPVRTPDDIARGLLARHSHGAQEELGAVYLNARHVVIREVPAIYRGTVNSATVSTREVVRIGMQLNAVAVIVFHQHPSGLPDPSSDDVLYTRKLAEACKSVDMELLDHLVLGHNRFVSMKSKGYI